MTVTFDPIHYKATTGEQWEDAAAAWHAWGLTLEDWLGEATTLMLDAAGVHTGSVVLDVAAGAGGQSLLAGRLTRLKRDEAWQEIHRELSRFEDTDGFEGPCELIVVWG
jgi:hypothetical protein